jgi:ATP-dependent Clp protease protease subunit
MTSYPIPSVTTSTPTGEKTVDIYSRLLDERIVYLGTPVDDGVANAVIAPLLHLESESADAPVSLYINSPGGSLSATMAIVDCMEFIRPQVETTCVGQAVASAALLLAAGTPGHRAILRHGRVVLAAPVTEGGRGTIPDLIIEAEEMERIRRLQESVLASHCGRTADQVREDTERQLVLTPDAAVDYGIVDRVLTQRTWGRPRRCRWSWQGTSVPRTGSRHG